MLFKSPELLVQWRFFHSGFQGRLFSGPFSKVLSLVNQIGWAITSPPLVQDHDGFTFDLIHIDTTALDELLYEGWLQHVARSVSHRSTMRGLCGIDPYITRSDHHRLIPRHYSLTQALQGGSFVSAAQHAKYDLTKDKLCSNCGVEDNLEHWFVCDKFADFRADEPSIFSLPTRAPDCMLHHLLVPRSPWTPKLKAYFMHLPTSVHDFLSQPADGIQHVFTDGSAFQGSTPRLCRAAWAAINASSGEPIAAAPLAGLSQTIGRAELTAVLTVLHWVCYHEVHTVIWSDSRSTVDRLLSLIAGVDIEVSPHWENFDLWQQVEEALQQVQTEVEVRWIPSHLDFSKCENTFEEWICLWNSAADSLAVQVNEQRSDRFRYLHQQEQEYYDHWQQISWQIRDYLLALADHKHQQPSVTARAVEPDDTDWQTLLGQDSATECIAVDWPRKISTASLKYPAAFYHDILQELFGLEDASRPYRIVSIVELTLWLAKDRQIFFPEWTSTTERWELTSLTNRFIRPTLAFLISQIRRSIIELFGLLEIDRFYRKGLMCTAAAARQDGIPLRVPCDLDQRFTQLVSSFSVGGLIRRASDLAKPI